MREVLAFAVLSVWEWITVEGTEKRDFYFTLSEAERTWKYARGEISLLVILHAAETDTITNTQKAQLHFVKRRKRQNYDIRVMKGKLC